MSYLMFQFAEGGEARLKGPEWHYLDSVVNQTAVGAIGLVAGTYGWSETFRDQFAPFMPEHAGLAMDEFVHRMSSPINAMRGIFSWKGKTIHHFALMLNTALVAGSDPVALAAKIAGSGEIHGFIEGKDRAWAADIIEQGCETGIYRKSYWDHRSETAGLLRLMNQPVAPEDEEIVEKSMGWTEIAAGLRADDKGEAVMSYSIEESFLRPTADFEPEGMPEDEDEAQDARYEAWDELPWEKQWELRMAELRASKGRNIPISPVSLRGTLFKHELTLLDLARHRFDKIEKALHVE